jgi:hypothetical protein
MPINGAITAAMVKDAARRVGVRLDDGAWYEPPKHGRPACACPLAALILAEHPGINFGVRLNRPFFPRHAAQLLGISEARADGFTAAFDGTGRCYRPGYDAEYDRGFGEGAACRAELIPVLGSLLAEM